MPQFIGTKDRMVLQIAEFEYPGAVGGAFLVAFTAISSLKRPFKPYSPNPMHGC